MLCFNKEIWLHVILNFLLSETIAFHTVLTSYSSIPDESAVLFNEVLLNEGDGWVFTRHVTATVHEVYCK